MGNSWSVNNALSSVVLTSGRTSNLISLALPIGSFIITCYQLIRWVSGTTTINRIRRAVDFGSTGLTDLHFGAVQQECGYNISMVGGIQNEFSWSFPYSNASSGITIYCNISATWTDGGSISSSCYFRL